MPVFSGVVDGGTVCGIEGAVQGASSGAGCITVAVKVRATHMMVAHSCRACVLQGSSRSKMGLNDLSNKDVSRIQVDVCEASAVRTSRRVSAAVVSVVVVVVNVRS